MPTIPEIHVPLHFRSGAMQLATAGRFKTALENAYLRSFGKFMTLMTAWADAEVPEFNSMLIGDFRASANTSGTNKAFTIGNPNTLYASYVDKMTNVNWTKFGRNPAKDHYFKRARAFMSHIIPRVIMQSCIELGLDVKMGGAATAVLQLFRF